MLANIFPNLGVLGGNHLVAIAGTLGFLPLWVTTEIEMGMGRTMKWLLTRFYLDKKERGTIKLDDIILNLMAALTTQNKGFFLRRMVENIICKVFRHQNLKKVTSYTSKSYSLDRISTRYNIIMYR